MIKNYFIAAYRNLLRKKLYSLINLTGLTLGITCCLLIFLYVQNEYNYDRFHADGDRVFRVIRKSNDDKGAYKIGITSAPFAPALANDFENIIVNTTRILATEGLITSEGVSFMEEKISLADPTFFDVFSFPLVSGDPKTALNGDKSVVISQKMAKKYFGNQNPIDKIIVLDQEFELKVTGVLDQFPGNSHLQFDFLVSMAIVENKSWFSDWWSNNLYTYVKLKDPGDRHLIDSRLGEFMEKYFGDHFENTGTRMDLLLEPLSEIYFNNQTQYDEVAHGDKSRTTVFILIAIFILAIACINFLNLATATAASRAKEVGIRKTSGAGRKDLIVQFLIESFIFSFVATILAFFLAEIGFSLFNQFIGKEIIIVFNKLTYLLLAFTFVFTISILSGLYPALVLSSFQPSQIMRQNLFTTNKGGTLRKFLVVFQFSVSLILMLATIVVIVQLDYVRNKELGFNKDNIVLLPFMEGAQYEKREQIKKQLLSLTSVKHITFISGEPGGFHDNHSFALPGEERKNIKMRTVFTDHDFQHVFDIPLVKGRTFSEEFRTDAGEAIIINEEAVKYLGWQQEEVLGKYIQNNFTDTIPRKVIGVIKNYHFASLKRKIDPLVITIGSNLAKMAVKIDGKNTMPAIKEIEKIWSSFAIGYPVVYHFMDEQFDNLYRAEKKQKALFTIFTGIAILIACMGLFGLTTYSVERRIKEIGIRKILGARVATIFILLSKDLLKLVVIACLIALPAAWWFVERWLDNFAYRINIEFWMILLAILTAVIIAFLTVCYHGLKASYTNPVNALRTE
ncbi:ABC transporter permease [Fulvivirgaceae bacterium BMA12]|uniref:ABC transporter permease n=1 Tax=Agaribacillus aureus TaxID=3051825 RepID=A0ABT8L7W3_9BACT|nr:ABC transporter permease [Fulvivirgaceae bacterium BMA12]